MNIYIEWTQKTYFGEQEIKGWFEVSELILQSKHTFFFFNLHCQ